MPAVADTSRTALAHYLRALWGVAPPLQFDADWPFIAVAADRQRVLHLPAVPPPRAAREAWSWHCAAAAHAAAHLVFSPPVFDGRGLKPIVRALVGVLEDARVEALAARQLPGLGRLWRRWHDVVPADGGDVETLLLRLARALADPAYDDPHPWVRKGVALCFADAGREVLSLTSPEALRQAASRLGHDLGQMRLQFNGRLYRPGPGYRDDHRWMWPAPTPPDEAPAPAETRGRGEVDDAPPPPEQEPDDTARSYPEWDRLIERLRLDWCLVTERPVPAATPASGAVEPAARPPDRALARAVRAALAAAAPTVADHAQRVEAGHAFDTEALLRARLAQRLGRPFDPRLYRQRPRRPAQGSAVLLVDQSASSAARWGDAEANLLQGAADVAALLAQGWQAQGMASAVWAFRSAGRRHVGVQRVKGFEGPLDDEALARLARLQPGGSTRLGAVIRHATQALGTRRAGRRCIVVIGDGEPHDIDVHDRRYLVADARRAVAEARRRGIAVLALVLERGGLVAAREMFGTRNCAGLGGCAELPRVLRRWRA